MKNFLLILFVALTISCYGQKTKTTMTNNKTYLVWTYIHEFGRNINTGSREEADVLAADTDFISSLPQGIKVIIAYYSTRIHHNLEVDSIRLAKSLGDFSTLEEAQLTLLKDWKYDETLSKSESKNQKISDLYIMRLGTKIIFGYRPPRFEWEQEAKADEFKIDKRITIKHIKHYENVQINEVQTTEGFGYKMDYSD